jgi:hypothetical protein
MFCIVINKVAKEGGSVSITKGEKKKKGWQRLADCTERVENELTKRKINGRGKMSESVQEQEEALLDLDSMTVLLIEQPENPFQDETEESVQEVDEEEALSAAPEEWLED